MSEEAPVTAEKPDSPVHMSGTDHVTIWGSNEADTVAFYRDLLGMPLVLRQPNLDDPSQTHLFFDTGDGRIITFFVSDDRPSNRGPQRGGVGAVHHLAFSFPPEDFASVMEALDDDGRSYNVFDRGIFQSLYTHDNNGLVIELTTDKFDVPEGRRGEVLAKTQEIREAAGSEFAEEEHMARALEELGLPADPADLPEAATGTSFE